VCRSGSHRPTGWPTPTPASPAHRLYDPSGTRVTPWGCMPKKPIIAPVPSSPRPPHHPLGFCVPCPVNKPPMTTRAARLPKLIPWSPKLRGMPLRCNGVQVPVYQTRRWRPIAVTRREWPTQLSYRRSCPRSNASERHSSGGRGPDVLVDSRTGREHSLALTCTPGIAWPCSPKQGQGRTITTQPPKKCARLEPTPEIRTFWETRTPP